MRPLLLFLFLVLSACANYDVKINEKVVYSPPPLFLDFSLTDRALQNCVEQTITDQGATKAEQLTRLICTNGDIRSAEGIEIFSGLQQLNLNNNSLQNISALAGLPALRNLSLASNKIKTVMPLTESTALLQLNVKNNPTLDCATLLELMNQVPALQVTMPTHCKGSPK
ncbi:MAG: leucine-rich repeat domain-containing protein [Pseudomonadales bacterium]